MLHYMHAGSYSWGAIPSDIASRFPNTTEFDFHVLVYLTALKYGADRLSVYARAQYLNMFDAVVGNELPRLQQEEKAQEGNMGYGMGGYGMTNTATNLAIFEDGPQHMQMNIPAWNRTVEARSRGYGNSANMPAFAPTVQTRLQHLFHSVMLLWRYKGGDEWREDPLRKEVVEGCKTHFVRLSKVSVFLECLGKLPGFKEGLEDVLEEEGLTFEMHSASQVQRRAPMNYFG
jgi:hypothetical protein